MGQQCLPGLPLGISRRRAGDRSQDDSLPWVVDSHPAAVTPQILSTGRCPCRGALLLRVHRPVAEPVVVDDAVAGWVGVLIPPLPWLVEGGSRYAVISSSHQRTGGSVGKVQDLRIPRSFRCAEHATWGMGGRTVRSSGRGRRQRLHHTLSQQHRCRLGLARSATRFFTTSN